MHASHGSPASVSTASSLSAASGLSTLSQKHFSTSRGGSISSASVVTIKRTGSLSSSSTGQRSSAVPLRTQSPSETSLTTLRQGREPMPQDRKRRKSVAVDPTDRASSSEGLDNLNRWSESTTSSANTRRSRASSGAVLPGLAHQSFSPSRRKRTTVDYSPRASPHRQSHYSRPDSRSQRPSPTPTSSPERERLRPARPGLAKSLTALPPLHTTPALIDAHDTESPSTIQTIKTPSTYSSYGQEYFGPDPSSPRSIAKSKKPAMNRNHTAPMTTLNSSRLQTVEGVEDAVHINRRSEYRDRPPREASPSAKHDAEGQRPASRPSSAADGSRHKRSRPREKGEKDKKAMLSKALQKANTAVLLDNAQNFEGALDAYNDACRLLQQVMNRSSGEDDKRKLDAIKITYTNRIEELRQLENAQPEIPDAKSLPARPMSDDSLPISPTSPSGAASSPVTMSPAYGPTVRDSAIMERAATPRQLEAPKLLYQDKDRDSFFAGTMQAVDDTSRQDFQLQKPPSGPGNVPAMLAPSRNGLDSQRLTDPEAVLLVEDGATGGADDTVRTILPKTHRQYLSSSEKENYIPAPLSPRRPLSPMLKPEAEQAWQEEPKEFQANEEDRSGAPEETATPGSWLNTIDESGSSCASSIHSVSSQQELRRKHIRDASHDTNPDFDAAFDAAVEAAYNEGLEPDTGALRDPEISGVARRTHVQQESVVVPSSEIKEILSPTNQFIPGHPLTLEPDDEEEERLLDDITQDYARTFNFDLSTKSALPRQSDSSGYSRSTWQSSQVSERTTAGSSLSTVAEDTLPGPGLKNTFAGSASQATAMSEQMPPPAPPPQTSLPKPPDNSQNRMSGIRSRRLSGQNQKQLKIETLANPEVRKRASTFQRTASPLREEAEQARLAEEDLEANTKLEPTVSDQQHERLLKSPPSLDMLSAISDSSRPLTATTATTEQRQSLEESPGELLTHRPNFFRKNKSSVSLREHTVLLASPTTDTGPSMVTPMSSTFMGLVSKRHNENPLTSQRANLPLTGLANTASDSLYSGGAYLFDTSLTTSLLPTSPRSPNSDQPSGLEPCPESFLLRPFWLMRSIASTLMRPKGGFLTRKVFVPREVWMTRGVKLKSVEDKIANCDLLTAALGRLSGVDTYDADAIMEELQNFEEVMERVQTTLTKKLGNDVGSGGLSSMFKDASSSSTGASASGAAPETTSGAEKTRSKENKGYLNSWRKLRSKSSGTPLMATQTNKAANMVAQKELPTMDSVPMTSFIPVERRGQKRDVRSLVFEGPNREYMGSLARLFEGVQALDQIARQVEDPGLRGTSPTHVGLELSIRHASEFFGFYVCRFVLADLGTLLDKFVKRGTEWVLA